MIRFLLIFLLVLPAAAAVPVVVEGDSLFAQNQGFGNWTDWYPGVVVNNAAGGDHLYNICTSEYYWQDAPLAPTNGELKVFVLGGGINDLIGGTSAADMYHWFSDCMWLSGEDGFVTVACTVAPCGLLTPDQEAQRQIYNYDLRLGACLFGYPLLDFDALMPQNTANALYYQPDGLHWTTGWERFLGLYYIPGFLSTL